VTFLFDLLFFKFARVSIINRVRELVEVVVDIDEMSRLTVINVKRERHSLNAVILERNLSFSYEGV
jgi:hypothetical protein